MSATVRRLFDHAVTLVPPPGKNPNVHLALSGGVDSSVAGLLLRERGYTVHPVLLRCWDEAEEQPTDDGPPTQCFTAELRAAEEAASALRLPHDLRVVDLVSAYWTHVFDGELLAGLREGRTPNPDLACNRLIKFDALPDALRRMTGLPRVCLATGHYARVPRVADDDTPRLLRAADPAKDQTYFLASVPSRALRDVMMPLGPLFKTDVRAIATEFALPAATRRSSRGLCFVGKRRFASFIADFAADSEFDAHAAASAAAGARPGPDYTHAHPRARFVRAARPHAPLGTARYPAWAYTVGQRARVAGRDGRLFVAGVRGRDVFVTEGSDWRLWTREVVCDRVDWVSGQAPAGLDDGLRVEYKCCSSAPLRRGVATGGPDGRVHVLFDAEERRIADGQAVVLYKGAECLGAAWPVDQGEWLGDGREERDECDESSGAEDELGDERVGLLQALPDGAERAEGKGRMYRGGR